MKRKYLVVHDYGMGGVWAILSARTEQEIREKYPDVEIGKARPAWMSDADYNSIRDKNSFDIDAVPEGWLAILTKASG